LTEGEDILLDDDDEVFGGDRSEIRIPLTCSAVKPKDWKQLMENTPR
jgi:hypothetical protein